MTRFKYFWRRYLGWLPVQFCMVCGRPYWGGLPRFWIIDRALRWTWLAWWMDYCSKKCADIDTELICGPKQKWPGTHIDFYKDLGDLSAVEPWAKVALRCDRCAVKWIGCMDAAACPQCGNTEAWEQLMRERGHYK